MTPWEAIQWIGVVGLAVIVLLLIGVIALSFVNEYKKNPLKKSFDTDPDVFNSHPEEKQDK